MKTRFKNSKHKSKLSEDLPEIKSNKKVFFNDIVDDTINIKDTNRTNSVGHSKDFHKTRKRNHTKVSKKSKKNDEDEMFNEDSQNGRKIKFGKIEVIDIECWKKINLKLTAEENSEEILKLSKGKKGRNKNVNCDCIII